MYKLVCFWLFLGIAKIWHYKRKTRKCRAKAGLPQLYDEDDLPDPAYDPNYVHVLSEKEQADLHRRSLFFLSVINWQTTVSRTNKIPTITNVVSSSWHRNASRRFWYLISTCKCWCQFPRLFPLGMFLETGWSTLANISYLSTALVICCLNDANSVFQVRFCWIHSDDV